MSTITERKQRRERIRLYGEYDAERDKESARSDREMAVETGKRKEKVGDIVDKLAEGNKLAVADLNYLATPAVRLEYMIMLREKGHDPDKFVKMFDVLEEIALDKKVTPQNRVKAANAYISRVREMFNLDGSRDELKGGVTNILVVQGDLIAGGKGNRDTVQPVREAEIID